MTAPTVKASAPTGLAIASSARKAQLVIAAQAMKDATQLWPLLDPKRLDETWPGWLRAMIILAKSYHSQSATLAGRFYQRSRELATRSPAPQSLIRLAPPPSDEWMTKAFGFSGPGQLSRDTARPNTALSTTLGTTSRIVQDGGRTTVMNTVHEDPVAVGWYRLTDGHPCAFCALLASRGVVYKSEKRADFQAHNECGCSAAVAFTRDQQLPALTLETQQVYRESTDSVSGAQKLVAFRKAWAEHQAQS